MIGEIASLSAAILWAISSLIFVRLGREGIHPIVMNTLKGGIALVMMLITIALLFGHFIPPQLTTFDTVVLAISGLIGITIGDTFYFYALHEIGPRRTLLFSALVPPMTAIFAFFFLGEALTPTMFLGMSVTIVGIVWVLSEKHNEQETHIFAYLKMGLLFAFISIFCQSAGNILTKFSSSEISSLGISILRIGGALIGLSLFMTWKGWWKKAVTPLQSSKTFSMVLVATILSTYLGIWLLNAGLKHTANTGVAATLLSTSPIFILPLAAIVEKERISPRAILGSVIAVAGIAILFL